MSIQYANEAALRRHSALRSRRYPIELVDSWVNEVETLIEHKNRVVPEPLITEIAGFLGQTDTRIYRRLRRNGKPDTGTLLEILFEVEERLLWRATRLKKAWP
jgi:hypothetical protein